MYFTWHLIMKYGEQITVAKDDQEMLTDDQHCYNVQD